jgi:CRP-like cAMP-binding protein
LALPLPPQNRTARTLKACKIPFFATLSDFTFQLIAEVSHVLTFNQGEYIFRVRLHAPSPRRRLHHRLSDEPLPVLCLEQGGDPGDNFYIICEGSVAVCDAQTEQEFKTLNKGDYFGELALLTEKPRSATVMTKEPCLMLAISKEVGRGAIR